MTQGTNEDRDAVLAVIEAETEAYLQRDYDAWQSCWLDGPQTRRVQTHVATGVTLVKGGEIKEQMRRIFLEPVKWSPPKAFERENLNMVISPEMAWVSYDQNSDMSSNADGTLRRYHELKILQKVDGVWKISCLVSTQIRANYENAPLIEVDRSGEMIWMNESAKKRLPLHPMLSKKGRKLCAIDDEARMLLLGALNWLYEIRSHLTPGLREEALSRIVPLGQDDAGVAHVCWALLRDGRFFIAFDDEERLNSQVAAAAEAYGLSDTQEKLALKLMAGADISTAAEILGISPNTAKTHLQRIYDKIGVRSQSALVRMLLTAVRREV
ncbi:MULTISPECIES: LuxR C-terminal-related transcriptional regulator [unclassified Ruegeria]|uniref:LuxR C-terminal-related transcriptional regulator n=1 Tax=unclassified Ruegeria TaxID=2625375 RepID=UPI0014888D02|nr:MULTISPECIES: LuxR C-terminal-related transcriptional regulator [unclassified Ruegeria]